MAESYGEAAEFYVVYIREAHAADSTWPMPIPEEEAINTPKTYADRLAIAGKCVTKLKLKIPCLVDDMEDSTEKAYGAWPDRLFVVDTTGKIVVRGEPGPFGFQPSVKDAAEWLQEKFPKIESPKLNLRNSPRRRRP